MAQSLLPTAREEPLNRNEPVRFLMTQEVTSVQITEPISHARTLLQRAHFHHLPVCNGKVLVGILSKSDLAPLTLERYVPDDATVNAWLDQNHTIAQTMSYDPIALSPDTTVKKAAEYFASGEFHALPVVDERNQLIGVVTTTDLARWVASGS